MHPLPLEFEYEIQKAAKILISPVDINLLNLLSKTPAKQSWNDKFTYLEFLGKIIIRKKERQKFLIEINPSSIVYPLILQSNYKHRKECVFLDFD